MRVQKAYFLETPHFGSTSQYNMNRKTIRFILAVSAEHRRYNNILYNIFYYIQICGVIKELVESWVTVYAEYSQNRGQKKPARKKKKKKNLPQKKTRQEMWVGSMAHALKSPSYEGYTAGRTLIQTIWDVMLYSQHFTFHWKLLGLVSSIEKSGTGDMQQFWQMHGKGHFGPTDRNDQNGHSGPLSKLVPIPVGPNRNGPFHLSWGANRNYRNFGLNGKRPTSDKRPQKFHTDDASLPRSEWCSRLVENLHHPIRSTTQIWVVTRHQYGISVTVSQTSFRGETTSGGRREMSAVFSGYSRLLRRETYKF